MTGKTKSNSTSQRSTRLRNNKVRKVETNGRKYVLDLLSKYPKSKFNKLPNDVRRIILFYSHPQNVSSYSRTSKQARQNVSLLKEAGLNILGGKKN